MPTEEEFRLYERMPGGTGDIAQDAHIAKHLQRIVNVPEREIVSFVRTRDRGTVHKLREVLKEMPRGQEMQMGGPRAGTRPQPAGMAAMHTEQTRGKIRDMASAWKSNYAHQCNGDAPIPSKATSCAFDGIVRNGFQPHFEQWRNQADASKVDVFAEACRSLRNFTTSQEKSSCYRDMFPRYNDADIRPPPDRNNKKSFSVMTVLNPTKGEVEALKTRDRTWRDTIAAAWKREKEVLDGSALLPQNKMKMSLCAFPVPPEASTEQCLKASNIKSVEWRSEGKVAWNNDVHSTVQGGRMGLSRTRRGEMKLKLEGCAADTQRRPLAGGHQGSQSSPTLSRSG